MNQISLELFEKYEISRFHIQLTEAKLEEIRATNLLTDSSGDGTTEMNLFTKLEPIDSLNCDVYLKAIVKVVDKSTGKLMLEFDVVYKGRFTSVQEIPFNELRDLANMQIVPQLLPYVRTAISTACGMMTVPPVVMPTMDVLESLKRNQQRVTVLGEGEE